MSKVRDLTVSQSDLYTMLLCSLRYAMGRQSYITGLTCDLIRAYGVHLEAGSLAKFAREIRQEIALAKREGRHLGMLMDQQAFEALASDIEDGKLQ